MRRKWCEKTFCVFSWCRGRKKAERTQGMDALMLHNGYKLPAGVKMIAYNAMYLAKTSVVKIEVSEITGKRHLKN